MSSAKWRPFYLAHNVLKSKVFEILPPGRKEPDFHINAEVVERQQNLKHIIQYCIIFLNDIQ